jgi:hypothetical protein
LQVKKEIRKLPVNQIRAAVSDGSINESDRTVELVWTTGSKGLRSSWGESFYEELSLDPKAVDMSRLQEGAPLLANHNRDSLDSVVGVVEKAWLTPTEGRALVRFASDAASDLVFQKVKEKVLRNVSVGYSVSSYEDVSGKNDEVRTYRAVRWQPQELSIVPIGFDQKAQVRNELLIESEVEIVHRSETFKEGSVMPPEEIKPVETPVVEAAPQIDVKEIETRAVEAERTRVQEIAHIVDVAGLDKSIATQFIARGASVDEARKEVFTKMSEKSKATQVSGAAPSVEITRDEKQSKIDGVSNLLLHKMNSKNPLDENGKRFYGMSMVRIAEDLIGGRHGLNDIQLATRALTTSDFSNILANVAEKSMRQAYNIQPQTFKPFVKEGTLRNYKTANRLMLGDFPSLDAISEHGEFKYGKMSESKETIQLARYGKAMSFTKEMLVNDDLGAFNDFAGKSARACARLESSLVYTSTLVANPTMGDGIALFHASHNNYVSSGTTINVANIATMSNLIRAQTTLDGVDYADLTPKFLICGPAMELLALQYTSAAFQPTAQSSINPFAGRLSVIVDPRISGNGWYLACDPSEIDTIELAKLEGQESPIVTIAQNPTKPGALEIFVEHNVGAAVLDYRGLAFNAGT